MNQPNFVMLTLCALGFAPACNDDSNCDPGQVERNAVCVDADVGGAAGSAAGGSSQAPEQGSAGQSVGGDSGASGAGGVASTGGESSTVSTADLFGTGCTGDTDCTAPVDYCAKMPGEASGYCTQQGCKADASICPTTWTCFDLATMGVANGPNFCMKPN